MLNRFLITRCMKNEIIVYNHYAMFTFPKDIVNIILDYVPKSEFLPWIDFNKIDWKWLSCNTAAIHILERNLDKVNWSGLSRNAAAIHILERNLDKVDWCWLSSNTAAIHILEHNLDKVDWRWLSFLQRQVSNTRVLYKSFSGL